MMRSPWWIILAFGLALAGCASAPPGGMTGTVSPESRAEPKLNPKVIADSIGELRQELFQTLTQIQTTISTQIQNFMLDPERAKLERDRNANLIRGDVAVGMMLMGLALLCLCSPALANGTLRIALVAVAIAMIAGPGVFLLVRL